MTQGKHETQARPCAPLAGKAQAFSHARRALAWVKAHSLEINGHKAIPVSGANPTPYPEVTGYYIPTLLSWGEAELAKAYAAWLITVQNPDGSFSGPGIKEAFAFDTGQAIRGLAAIMPSLPEAGVPLARACDWIMKTASPAGRLALPANLSFWSLGPRGNVNEAIHLYVLPGLLAAAEALGDKRYRRFAERSLDYYIQHCNLTNFLAPNMLLHFYCYIQEALFDLGATEVCRGGMRDLDALQREDGLTPAYAGCEWICSPGLIQAGATWLKLGELERGNKALACATGLMSPTGGFAGSLGQDADYFPGEEISWPVKFYLDALALLLKQHGAQPPGEITAVLTDAARNPGPENLETVNNAAASAPAQGAIIALQRFAITGLRKELAAASASADGTESLKIVAAAIPVLLEWGEREEALQAAGELARRLPGWLADWPQAGSPPPGQDSLLAAALAIRALRQPETGQSPDPGQTRALLQELAAKVFALQKTNGRSDPWLALCFAEIAAAGTTSGEDGWADLASAWAARHGGQAAPPDSPWFFLQSPALERLLSPQAGALAYNKMLDALPEGFLESGISWGKCAFLSAIALCAFKLNNHQAGDRAFKQAQEALARLSGDADDERAGRFTACYFFLEALSAMLTGSFVRHFPDFLTTIAKNDERLSFVREHLPARAGARLLDLGCGKGRYLKRLIEAGTEAELVAQDVHEDFKSQMPAGVEARVGSMLRSGHADASFDAVMLCEVLEHCVNLPAAIREMHRILKPGGKLVIIDKDIELLAAWPGGLPDWEQWFDPGELASRLAQQGFAIENCRRDLVYENARLDGLFFGISAVKTAGGAAAATLETAVPAVPLVSVVLPTYNDLEFLPGAIASLLEQTYENLEIIIVDDGSTDGTGEYLAGLSSPRLRVVSGPNTRLPSALNRGFAKAAGDYLTWTSADNICLPRFAETLAQALRAYPQAGFAYSDFLFFSDNAFEHPRNHRQLTLHGALALNPGVASFMYAREAAGLAGPYNPELEGAEDWDMWLRLLEVCRPVHVGATLYRYRLHANSMTFTMRPKIIKASRLAAESALKRRSRGGLGAFFPELPRCVDQRLAELHANLELGVQLLHPHSFLKGYAVRFMLAAARGNPADQSIKANLAIALACSKHQQDALALLAELQPFQGLEMFKEFVDKSLSGALPPDAPPPLFTFSDARDNELMRRTRHAQLEYVPNLIA